MKAYIELQRIDQSMSLIWHSECDKPLGTPKENLHVAIAVCGVDSFIRVWNWCYILRHEEEENHKVAWKKWNYNFVLDFCSDVATIIIITVYKTIRQWMIIFKPACLYMNISLIAEQSSSRSQFVCCDVYSNQLTLLLHHQSTWLSHFW